MQRTLQNGMAGLSSGLNEHPQIGQRIAAIIKARKVLLVDPQRGIERLRQKVLNHSFAAVLVSAFASDFAVDDEPFEPLPSGFDSEAAAFLYDELR